MCAISTPFPLQNPVGLPLPPSRPSSPPAPAGRPGLPHHSPRDRYRAAQPGRVHGARRQATAAGHAHAGGAGGEVPRVRKGAALQGGVGRGVGVGVGVGRGRETSAWVLFMIGPQLPYLSLVLRAAPTYADRAFPLLPTPSPSFLRLPPPGDGVPDQPPDRHRGAHPHQQPAAAARGGRGRAHLRTEAPAHGAQGELVGPSDVSCCWMRTFGRERDRTSQQCPQ